MTNTSFKRFRNRWTIREILQLQREFELLKLSIDEIALRHQRTPNAIMYKLDREGLGDYNVLYSNYHNLNSPMEVIRKHTYDEFEGQSCNEFLDFNEINEDDEDDEDDDDDDDDEVKILKEHIVKLENQIESLIKLTKNTSRNKSVFSLFG
jgi:hypothetical protein